MHSMIDRSLPCGADDDGDGPGFQRARTDECLVTDVANRIVHRNDSRPLRSGSVRVTDEHGADAT